MAWLPLSLRVLLLGTALSSALRVEKGGSPNEWIVRPGNSGSDDALRAIVSSGTVPVYIQYAASRDVSSALATVRLASDPSLSDRFPGLSSLRDGELRVAPQSFFSLVEITVHAKQQLAHVTAASFGDVVVDHDVFIVEDASTNVSVTTSSDGDVYLPRGMQLHVAGLSLASSSRGSVRLVAAEVRVNSLDIQTTSMGSVKLHTDSLAVADSISTRALSYGGVSLSASTLHAAGLFVETSSSGDALILATHTASSSVEQCRFQLTSVGKIQAGSVACKNAIVENSGVSEATVRVSDTLTYSTSAFGNVFYTGAKPREITMSSGRQGHAAQPAVLSEVPEAPSWVGEYTLPPHEPLGLSPPKQPKEIEKGAVTVPIHPTLQYNLPWLLVGLTVLVLALYAAERHYQRRARLRQRAEEAPLLSKDEPVYI